MGGEGRGVKEGRGGEGREESGGEGIEECCGVETREDQKGEDKVSDKDSVQVYPLTTAKYGIHFVPPYNECTWSCSPALIISLRVLGDGESVAYTYGTATICTRCEAFLIT